MPVRKQSAFIAPAVTQIQNDTLSDLAAKYWSSSDEISNQFDKTIVEFIYTTELKPGNFDRKRIMILEFSQYLENYLWKFYDSKASSSHVLSILIIINEKSRQKVNAWNIFLTNTSHISSFFSQVYEISLQQTSELSYKEKIFITEFFINCINNIEIDQIRLQLQEIISLSMWKCILPNRLEYELNNNKFYKKMYSKISKKTQNEDFNRKSTFISKYINQFIETVDSILPGSALDSSLISFCEYFMYFLIELESLLSTRRFFHVLFDDHHVLVKLRLSNLIVMEEGRIFKQLWEILNFYYKLQIDEFRGVELNQKEALERHYENLTKLQKIAFLYFKTSLKELYLSSVASIDSRESLIKHLSNLNEKELHEFSHKCNLINYKNGNTEQLDKAVIIELLISKFEKSQTLIEKINSQPLYPTEQILWYQPILPDDDWSGENCLALPKLNLQFLTLSDYLWRNFTLFSLESTFSIKYDIEDALKRLKPWMNEVGDTEFSGWARMAAPMHEFNIVEIGPLNIGTSFPQYIYADLVISTKMRQQFKEEWLNLRKHDPCFLVCVECDFIPSVTINEESFIKKYGLKYLRGCEIVGIINDDGQLIEDGFDSIVNKTGLCKYRVSIDPCQYIKDHEDPNNNIYHGLNVIIRRKPKENNFKAVLETIRNLMNTECLIPDWLGDIFLGYGDPSLAHYSKMKEAASSIDFCDTFLSQDHIKSSFPNNQIHFNISSVHDRYWRLTFPTMNNNENAITAVSYNFTRTTSLYNNPKLNKISFTPMQIEAIKSGLQHGLSMIVGPPGTGKTDVAVQIITTLYNTFPSQRTLIVTHSNQALNQIFEKIANLDVDERHLLRLGHGEEELSTSKNFSRKGRVDYILNKRIEILNSVLQLHKSIDPNANIDYSCETACHFYTYQLLPKINEFYDHIESKKESLACISAYFPFTNYFSTLFTPLFYGRSYDEDLSLAKSYFNILQNMFVELQEYRSFELLRLNKDRSNYLLIKTAKIIAMTCVHAALKRQDLVDLRFSYDNIIMEETAQILEIETFIPLLLQNPHDGKNRLKRIILIGDHHQLPPIVRNLAFQKFSNMEQSLFTRFIRLGVPHIELDQQGRCRPSLCDLFSWRYKELKTLPLIYTQTEFNLANPGFLFDYQIINVDDFQGVGESEPTRYFYQNLGEAEYAVSIYIYMRLIGYPAEKITILTTYNGQKHLIRDIIKKKCSENAILGEPAQISTVDRYQGQQNDYIILSLVRSKTVGHLRDVRRLIVAMSRARLGLYILGRVSLFSNCYELMPSFQRLFQFPTTLHIVTDEFYPPIRTNSELNCIPNENIISFQNVTEFSDYVHKIYIIVAQRRQLIEKQLDEERKKLQELQMKEQEEYKNQIEKLVEANVRPVGEEIQNEVIDRDDITPLDQTM